MLLMTHAKVKDSKASNLYDVNSQQYCIPVLFIHNGLFIFFFKISADLSTITLFHFVESFTRFSFCPFSNVFRFFKKKIIVSIPTPTQQKQQIHFMQLLKQNPKLQCFIRKSEHAVNINPNCHL